MESASAVIRSLGIILSCPLSSLNGKLPAIGRFSWEGPKVSDGLKWGPFVSVVSGTWTIHHDRRVRQFAWISGVAGIGADVGLGHWGSVRPRLVADVGFSFGNSGTIKTSNGSHDLEKYHYDPGFYLRAGLLFEF